jgi:hypothetical protein
MKILFTFDTKQATLMRKSTPETEPFPFSWCFLISVSQMANAKMQGAELRTGTD